MYVIAEFPATAKLDANSQRLMRAGHDASASTKKNRLQDMGGLPARKTNCPAEIPKALEEVAFEKQENHPVTMAEFKRSMTVRQHAHTNSNSNM